MQAVYRQAPVVHELCERAAQAQLMSHLVTPPVLRTQAAYSSDQNAWALRQPVHHLTALAPAAHRLGCISIVQACAQALLQKCALDPAPQPVTSALGRAASHPGLSYSNVAGILWLAQQLQLKGGLRSHNMLHSTQHNAAVRMAGPTSTGSSRLEQEPLPCTS